MRGSKEDGVVEERKRAREGVRRTEGEGRRAGPMRGRGGRDHAGGARCGGGRVACGVTEDNGKYERRASGVWVGRRRVRV